MHFLFCFWCLVFLCWFFFFLFLLLFFLFFTKHKTNETMPLTYGLVARGTVVLAEYYAVHGKANRIARKIVSKIPPQPHKKSYTFDKFVIFFFFFFFLF